jgi:hypothetical protein
LIYLLERLIIAVPKVWFVNALRVLIGVLVAVLAASTFDLVLFEKEIRASLNASAEAKVSKVYSDRRSALQGDITGKKEAWIAAQARANCEANGTCGSGKPSIGPIYRELARQAEVLHQEYLAAEATLAPLQEEMTRKIGASHAAAHRESGILARMEALREYLQDKPHAQAFWAVLFSLVLALELIVVFTKSAFRQETVDDHIRHVRERVSRIKADNYIDVMVDPVARAEQLLIQGRKES